MFYSLPIDIQRRIYSFDPTYHLEFQNVLNEIEPFEKRIILNYCLEDNFSLVSSNGNTFKLLTEWGDILETRVVTYTDYQKRISGIINYCWYHFIKFHFINSMTEEEYDEIKDTPNAAEIILPNIRNFDDFMTDLVAEDHLVEILGTNLHKNVNYVVWYRHTFDHYFDDDD